MSPEVWLLPELHTALFDFVDMNQSTLNFETFTGYSNSLTTVTMTASIDICGGSNSTIVIDGKQYDGFAYLNYNDNLSGKNESNSLLSFIQKFNPCERVCPNAVNSNIFYCRKADWKDGVCDGGCNTEGMLRLHRLIILLQFFFYNFFKYNTCTLVQNVIGMAGIAINVCMHVQQ